MNLTDKVYKMDLKGLQEMKAKIKDWRKEGKFSPDDYTRSDIILNKLIDRAKAAQKPPTRIHVVVNSDTEEYFLTDRHSSGNLGDNWIPITTTLPMRVTPRKGLEDGIIDTLEKYFTVFHKRGIRIKNPFLKEELDGAHI